MTRRFSYLPFLNGNYSTAPGLSPINKGINEEDRVVFQLDEQYENYLLNKRLCRAEDIRKYYHEHNLKLSTIRRVNEFIAKQLAQEYPDIFLFAKSDSLQIFRNERTQETLRWDTENHSLEGEAYLSLFDALCCQVQEDVAVFQLEGERDWLSAIHLCSPNYWSPADKVGKPFHLVHFPVPEMDRTLQHYPKMLRSIVNSETPHTRFAWGITTDNRLNHHPEPPQEKNPADWHGKGAEAKQFFVRAERQNLVGFPDENAFLFTIKTYFYEINDLNRVEKDALLSALMSMTPRTLAYKGLTPILEVLKEQLA